MSFSPCIVVPVYNHSDTITSTVEGLRACGLPFFIIDDGSDRASRAVLQTLAADDAQITLECFDTNQGKGAAVACGLELAFDRGYTHALQIDADGQHDSRDAPHLLELARANPDSVISAQPVYDSSVPRMRHLSRYITHFWVALETLSLDPPDTMCGFRVYPLAQTHGLISSAPLGRRMDFDIEIIVRLLWQGVPLLRYDTKVRYPEAGRSHFRYFSDNLLISRMHARLFFGMIFNLPTVLKQSWRRGH